jgi:hypothetical protein
MVFDLVPISPFVVLLDFLFFIIMCRDQKCYDSKDDTN